MPKADYIYADPTEFTSSQTPFGIYDNDPAYRSESINICKYVARRLGHPVMQLEFSSGSIWTMFEEAINEYSTHINNYNTKNWMFDSYGTEQRLSGSGYSNDGTSSLVGTGSFQPRHPSMGSSFILSDQYGQAANIGGDVTLHSGSITLADNVQQYDLQNANITGSHKGKRLEIQRVFNQGPSAITRFYDPFAGSFDQRNMLDNFGMGNVAPSVSFILRPIHWDITRAQMIETNDFVRKSSYSFELVNNKLRIFPIPKQEDSGDKLYFQYYVRDEARETTKDFSTGRVSDPSNIPYKFLTYSEINANGRQWIRKYTLALSRELLGIIRSKYSSMPLPNGDLSLDGEGMKAEGREEKANLLDELNTFLESVSLEARAEAEQQRAESNQAVLNKAPLMIYLG